VTAGCKPTDVRSQTTADGSDCLEKGDKEKKENCIFYDFKRDFYEVFQKIKIFEGYL
jgi:hypothetical protein